MLWDEKTWKEMRERMFRAAKAMGAEEADAEDMASKAALALLEKVEKCADPDTPVEIENPAAYMNGALRFIGKAPVNGRHRKELVLEDPHESAGLCHEVDQGTLETLELATALQQVLHFGRKQEQGTTTLVLRASHINLSSVRMMLRYLQHVLVKAPVDPHIRRERLALFARLMRRAMDRVKLDAEHYPEDPAAFDQNPEGWISDEDNLLALSANAGDAFKLMKLLFPRMPEPVAMDHAVAIEEEVWQGRDLGMSGFMFLHSADHVPEDLDRDDLAAQLKRLWKWKDGGELMLTISDPCKIDLKVTARDRAFLVEAPTGEQCFGAPLPEAAEGCMLEALEYDPPDEEVDTYYTILEPEKAVHMADVAKFLLDTLEYVYGWNPQEGVEWTCEYIDWEEVA